MFAYVISNKNDPDLLWSIEEGWVTETYDTFDQNERDTFQLPIEGQWEKVPWSKC